MAGYCIRCHVNILDDAVECPLCQGVLKRTEDSDRGVKAGDTETLQVADVVGNAADSAASRKAAKKKKRKSSGKNKKNNAAQNKKKQEDTKDSVSLTYPDITSSVRLMQFIIRIVIFVAIAAEIVVLVANYKTFDGVYWSLIVGVGLIYGCLTLLYSVNKRRSYQRIILVQFILAIVLVIILDKILGFTGWSLDYAIPFGLMGVDIGVIVLMIIGIEGWQRYIMTEIVMFVFSIILVIFELIIGRTITFFVMISVLGTGLVLLGTIMLGQRMVSNELKRRFKI